MPVNEVGRQARKFKENNPELVPTLKDAKAQADSAVEKSLYQRAIGYSHPDVHISTHEGRVIVTPITKHYPPDTTACIYWTKNRRPDLWRDVQRVHHEGEIKLNVQLEEMSAEDLRADMIRRGEMSADGKLIAQRN